MQLDSMMWKHIYIALYQKVSSLLYCTDVKNDYSQRKANIIDLDAIRNVPDVFMFLNMFSCTVTLCCSSSRVIPQLYASHYFRRGTFLSIDTHPIYIFFLWKLLSFKMFSAWKIHSRMSLTQNCVFHTHKSRFGMEAPEWLSSDLNPTDHLLMNWNISCTPLRLTAWHQAPISLLIRLWPNGQTRPGRVWWLGVHILLAM